MINIRIILFLLTLTLLFSFLLRWQGKLEHSVSPLGIVSFELADNRNTAVEIRQAWKEEGWLDRARVQIWLDFLFIPLYCLLFYTLCGSISVRMHGFVAKLGIILAFGSVIAGAFDVVENICMLFTLKGFDSAPLVWLTGFSAAAKFTLLGLALLYVIPLGLRLVFLRLSGKYPA